MTEHEDQTHLPGPTLWPIGFAVGVACVLVGLVVSVWALVVGVIVAIVFGFLWVRDLVAPAPQAAPAAPAGVPAEAHPEQYDRSAFLSISTLGLGGVIGGIVTLPVLGFMVVPAFTKEDVDEVDLGPIANFPEGKYVIATYFENPAEGEVSRRTSFVRYNGLAENGEPSFSILFSRCVHLGCPVQPNGPFDGDPVSYTGADTPEVTLQPVLAASFGCPCHGGQYDAEGNRTAGPPVRALDRYAFSIRDGNLFLVSRYSVGEVQNTGSKALIAKYDLASPGVHVDGWEAWLYPIPVPGR